MLSEVALRGLGTVCRSDPESRCGVWYRERFYAVASVLVGCPAEDRPQRNSFDEKRIHTIDRGGEES